MMDTKQKKIKLSIVLFVFVVLLNSITISQKIYKFPNSPDKYFGLSQKEISLKKKLSSQLFYKYKLIKSEISDSLIVKNWLKYNDDFFQIDSNGKIRVEIGVPELKPEYKQDLLANDFEIVHEINYYHRYDGWLPFRKLENISSLKYVSFIRSIERPIINNTVITNGHVIHKSNLVRREWSDVTGDSIKIGVISDGVDHRNQSISADELSSITVIDIGSGDEGTAMLEIIYDIAPNAELFFSSPGNSEADMAANINSLVQAGCNIICDDISYYHEPAFENGIIGNKVNEVYNNGTLYISSVGNSGDKHYIGDYYNNGDNWNRFFISGGFSNFITISIPRWKIGKIILTWNDQYGKSGNDYDLYLYNSNFIYKGSSTNTQNGDDDPYESISWFNVSSNTTFHVAIKNVDGQAETRKLDLIIAKDATLLTELQNDESSVKGHQIVEGCMSIGAINDLYSGGFYLENFSSRGPALIFSFDGNGNPIDSTSIIKPDLVALDGVETYVGQQGNFVNPFWGTSASAPHVAAVAALLWSANPYMSNTQVRNYIEQNCDQIVNNFSGLPKNNNTGEGILNAVNALLEVKPPIPPNVNIINPISNDTLNDTVNIKINTTDNSANGTDDGIDSVEIYFNNIIYLTDYDSSYNNIFNTLLLENNNYQLKVLAYDIVGASSVDTVDVVVDNPYIIWTGNKDSIWNDTSNWDVGVIPDHTKNVRIPSVPLGNIYPIISILNAECNSIKIDDSAILTINGNLTIGDVTPIVNTDSITNITSFTVTSGGNVVADGGNYVTAKGVCWDTVSNPTLSNNYTIDGTGTGSFLSNITGLIENTTYFVRAYATNSLGTAYGNEEVFTTSNSGQPCPNYPTVIDADSNVYNTVQIGTQCWMAENLKYETSGSWWYNDDSTMGNIYGRLYTWEAALTACPSGWHLPSDEEWKTLEMALGMSQNETDKLRWRGKDEGGKMKEPDTLHWENPNIGATNISGFTGLPGGYRIKDGSFHEINFRGAWWTSSENNNSLGWGRDLRNDKKQIFRESYLKVDGRSVRCVKD